MDSSYSWILTAAVGVAYPAFSSLQAILSDSAEAALDWLKYWVIFGVFLFLEILLDPIVNPLPLIFPSYVILKYILLICCMVPTAWYPLNGTAV